MSVVTMVDFDEIGVCFTIKVLNEKLKSSQWKIAICSDSMEYDRLEVRE